MKELRDIEIYNVAHTLAMEVYYLTRNFPKEECYSLTSQLTRASRSVSLNIAEGWGRKIYPEEFKRFLVYAQGSLEETRDTLQYARNCLFINDEQFIALIEKYRILGAKLGRLYYNWKPIN